MEKQTNTWQKLNEIIAIFQNGSLQDLIIAKIIS